MPQLSGTLARRRADEDDAEIGCEEVWEFGLGHDYSPLAQADAGSPAVDLGKEPCIRVGGELAQPALLDHDPASPPAGGWDDPDVDCARWGADSGAPGIDVGVAEMFTVA